MTDAIYDRIARLWPLLSPPEDYAPEADRVRDILAHFGPLIGSDESDNPKAVEPTIVELGVGGGHTLYHLQSGFKCTGVDLSEPMLRNARKLAPSATFIAGDMRSIRLGRHFDAVLLHDAIDYMTTEADALAALQTAAAHLDSGGVAIVAPTYTTESFTDDAYAQDANSDGQIEVAFTSTVRRQSTAASTFELIMLIMAKENGLLNVTEDCHTCGLFSRHTWCELLDQSGFDVYVDEGDSPADDDDPQQPTDCGAVTWFIGVKR